MNSYKENCTLLLYFHIKSWILLYQGNFWVRRNPIHHLIQPPNFTNRETKAQEDRVTYPRSYSVISVVPRLYIYVIIITIKIQNTPITPKRPLLPPSSRSPPLTPATGNHQFAFCLCRLFLCVLELHVHGPIEYKLFYTYPCSLSIIFLRFSHAVACIRSSFLLLSSIPFYGYTTICLSVHVLIVIGVVCRFWLLWIKLLGMSMYNSLCGHMFSLLLGKYLGVEWRVI